MAGMYDEKRHGHLLDQEFLSLPIAAAVAYYSGGVSALSQRR